MKTLYSRLLCTFVGALALCSGQPSFADDSEVFTSTAFTAGAGINANVLFIIDTSGSMDAEVSLYDASFTYTNMRAGSPTCDANSWYYRTNPRDSRPPTTCSDANRIIPSSVVCRDAYRSIVANGWWSGRAAQINADSGDTAWRDITANTNRKIECQLDAGIHGDAPADQADTGTDKWTRGGSDRLSRWAGNANNQTTWTNRPNYTMFSGNYINWYNTDTDDLPDGIRTKTRMEIVKEVATGLIESEEGLTGVNLGLMRYSNNGGCSDGTNDGGDDEWEARGGMVTFPISPLTPANRAAMVEQINDWEPEGWTPLSETFYEAHQYLSGGTVTFGQGSGDPPANHYPSVDGAVYQTSCRADSNNDWDDRISVPIYPSIATSRVGGTLASTQYDSPMDFSCQETFIVYLTDGLPTQDTEVNSTIPNLPGFARDARVPYIPPDNANYATAPAAACPTNGPSNNAHGACMINLAGYMHHHDMRPTGVTGPQNVTTYVVGFGDDIRESADYLAAIAAAGGGEAYTQGDAAGLESALEEIFSKAKVAANSTAVSPTVAVNAFNRTRNLNTLFISVFAPTNKEHWPGNLKKYRLVNGQVLGAVDGVPAVDTDTDGAGTGDTNTGFFANGVFDLFNPSTSDWDGPIVTKGGAASRLPPHASRNIYTYLGSDTDLVDNPFVVTNTGIRLDHVGASTDEERTEIIEFTRGLDNNDSNRNDSTTDDRMAVGDPMHSRPAVAIYGGDEANPDGIVYTTTNDGMLHAFDMRTGIEHWAFIPTEVMPRLRALRRDRVVGQRSYGIDGDVRVFKYDVNGNGIIDTGDKMYLLFGFARGGAAYYALDVTAQNAPKFLWKKTDGSLPMLGQAWSPPQITRVNVGGSVQSDPQKFVAIFGAGYDTAQDGYQHVVDSNGNGIYMLELTTGNVLWSAGRTGTPGVNLPLDQMRNSIPAEVTVLDLNGDSFGDRMYVGDMGGRIWRFDIWHGQAPNNLVTGGVLATLGVGHTNPANPADLAVIRETRRFYNSADVSLVTPRGARPFFNIAIGSGYRGHPLDVDMRDRFYAIRDYRPFDRLLNNAYTTPITDGDLVNVTTNTNAVVADGAAGWKIELNLDGWRGEKVLGDSVTVGGVIFFPTFTPLSPDDTVDPCLPNTLNRTWAVYLDSAKPFGLLTGQDPGTGGGTGGWASDPRSRYDRNWLDGIAPGTSVIMGGNCNASGICEPVCLVGAATHKCPKVGGVTRTFWERRQ